MVPMCTSASKAATRTPHASPSARIPSFASYVRARQPVLLRTARSLTANPSDAEDLLQTALTKTYVAWDRIEDHRALDGYVRRALVNTRTSQWRKRKVDEFACDELPEPEAAPVADPPSSRRCATRCGARSWAARPAARHGRPAVLRGPERGADRRGARRLGRHRQERGVPRAGQAARGPGAEPVR